MVLGLASRNIDVQITSGIPTGRQTHKHVQMHKNDILEYVSAHKNDIIIVQVEEYFISLFPGLLRSQEVSLRFSSLSHSSYNNDHFFKMTNTISYDTLNITIIIRLKSSSREYKCEYCNNADIIKREYLQYIIFLWNSFYLSLKLTLYYLFISSIYQYYLEENFNF